MSSAKKKQGLLCDKCTKQSDCEYKPHEGTLVLLRCLDFTSKENSEGKK